MVMEFSDAAAAVVDLLNASPRTIGTAGEMVPTDRHRDDPTPFLLVETVGSAVTGPASFVTVSVVAFAATKTAAKQAANRALAVLTAHPGHPPISQVQGLTVAFADRDPTTRAHIASVTVRCSVRAVTVE